MQGSSGEGAGAGSGAQTEGWGSWRREVEVDKKEGKLEMRDCLIVWFKRLVASRLVPELSRDGMQGVE